MLVFSGSAGLWLASGGLYSQFPKVKEAHVPAVRADVFACRLVTLARNGGSGQKSAAMGPPGRPGQVNLPRPLSFGPRRSALQSWAEGRGPMGPGGDRGHELEGEGLAGTAVPGYLWGQQGPEGLGAHRGRGCRGRGQRLIGILGGPV